MYQIPVEKMVIGQCGEYQSTFNDYFVRHPRPECYPFKIEEIDEKVILLRYTKIYPASRFNNYKERDFGILTKRKLKRKNKQVKEGWGFMGLAQKYAHESIVFY